jgi:hydroxyacylglutathione hydrolase
MSESPKPPFRLAVIPVTPFRQNASILFQDETKLGTVVDPGGDIEQILTAVDKLEVTIKNIVITHGHIDHAGGATDLKEILQARYDRPVPVEGPHKDDQFIMDEIPITAMRFGITGARPLTPDRYLTEGETVSIAGLDFEVLHCPGHSPGSLVYVERNAAFVLVGDVLFQGSVGRTDFPYGDHAALIQSIKNKLFPLGDSVAFLPGHGNMSTIGAERSGNPYVK